MCTSTTSDQPSDMAVTKPPTVDPHWPMGPEVLDLFAIVRANVARTIAALNHLTDGGER